MRDTAIEIMDEHKRMSYSPQESDEKAVKSFLEVVKRLALKDVISKPYIELKNEEKETESGKPPPVVTLSEMYYRELKELTDQPELDRACRHCSNFLAGGKNQDPRKRMPEEDRKKYNKWFHLVKPKDIHLFTSSEEDTEKTESESEERKPVAVRKSLPASKITEDPGQQEESERDRKEPEITNPGESMDTNRATVVGESRARELTSEDNANIDIQVEEMGSPVRLSDLSPEKMQTVTAAVLGQAFQGEPGRTSPAEKITATDSQVDPHQETETEMHTATTDPVE